MYIYHRRTCMWSDTEIGLERDMCHALILNTKPIMFIVLCLLCSHACTDNKCYAYGHGMNHASATPALPAIPCHQEASCTWYVQVILIRYNQFHDPLSSSGYPMIIYACLIAIRLLGDYKYLLPRLSRSHVHVHAYTHTHQGLM